MLPNTPHNAPMRVLVTGSAGHLGEALMRTLRQRGHEAEGLDILQSRFTDHVGSVTDRDLVQRCTRGVDFVMHAATLHKPHVATHDRREFVATNIAGTLEVLEAALANQVTGVIFTSTTSTFGMALRPGPDEPAAWVTEELATVPRNIYGVTKTAAEDLCELFHRTRGLPCIVLRTSRFFPEEDDDAKRRRGFDDENLKANEYLHRRVDIGDAVEGHLLAAERAQGIGFGRYILSATTPFKPEHRAALRRDAPAVVRSLFPDHEEVYEPRGWRMLDDIDRVYVNQRARDELGWSPRFDFRHVLDRLKRGEGVNGPLAREVGVKGYHPESAAESLEEGPFPVEAND